MLPSDWFDSEGTLLLFRAKHPLRHMNDAYWNYRVSVFVHHRLALQMPAEVWTTCLQ